MHELLRTRTLDDYRFLVELIRSDVNLSDDRRLLELVEELEVRDAPDLRRQLADGGVAVARTMPNTPALVDEGATAICAGRHATGPQIELARHIFEAVGTVEVVPEYLMDAVTGLSGSGPAYVYMFIEALTDAGVKQGLPRPSAARLAAQTVYGAARLVLETEKHPAILRDEVTTPGGTAIAAVAELESHGLRTMLINAVATATERSRQLSKISKEE